MKKAGIPLPFAVVNQKWRDGCRYVGEGGWNNKELIASPIFSRQSSLCELSRASEHCYQKDE